MDAKAFVFSPFFWTSCYRVCIVYIFFYLECLPKIFQKTSYLLEIFPKKIDFERKQTRSYAIKILRPYLSNWVLNFNEIYRCMCLFIALLWFWFFFFNCVPLTEVLLTSGLGTYASLGQFGVHSPSSDMWVLTPKLRHQRPDCSLRGCKGRVALRGNLKEK